MKPVSIRNSRLLDKLDLVAEAVLKCPHSWKIKSWSPTLASLKAKMDDADFDGYPDSTLIIDYAYKNVSPALRQARRFLLAGFKHAICGEAPHWSYDGIYFMPPRFGHIDWHNDKNNPRKSIQFIWSGAKGYTIDCADGKLTKIPDRGGNISQGNWSCIQTEFKRDGKTWMAHVNNGFKPRIVIDISIPNKYTYEYQEALSFIRRSV